MLDHTELKDTKRINLEYGDLIREQREHLGISINQLAKAIGLSPTYIWMLERGERGATIGTLNAIADQLGIERFHLLTQANKIKPDNIPNDYKEVIVFAINSGADFWDSWPDYSLAFHKAIPRQFHLSRAQINRKANAVLKSLTELYGIQVAPPIPVQEIAELLCGYEVVYSDNFDHRGEINYSAGKIYINSRYTSEQRRFTLGHELGHHFMSIYDDYIERPKGQQRKIREIEANQFASAILMPSNWVRYYTKLLHPKEQKSRLKIANIFQVSLKALEIRLAELNIRPGRSHARTSPWQWTVQ